MKETRLWYCSLYDKTINIKIESKHIKAKTHKRKQNKNGTPVEEYQFTNPDNDEVNHILNDTIEDGRSI